MTTASSVPQPHPPRFFFFLSLLLQFILPHHAVSSLPWGHRFLGWRRHASDNWMIPDNIPRGGGAKQRKASTNDVFHHLARAVQNYLEEQDDNDNEPLSLDALAGALKSLAKAQTALKGLDGVAHEAYQRTKGQKQNDNTDPSDSLEKVSGRAARTAARTSAVASALGACELCDLLVGTRTRQLLQEEEESQDDKEDSDDSHWFQGENGTLTGRQVVFDEIINNNNDKQTSKSKKEEPNLPLRVVVLYEPHYRGGAGVHHESIREMTTPTTTTTSSHENEKNATTTAPAPRRGGGGIQGRLLIVVGQVDDNDNPNDHSSKQISTALHQCLTLLHQPPAHVRLHQSGLADEAASVQPTLYRAANELLLQLEPILTSPAYLKHGNNSTQTKPTPTTAIHLTGHGLAGGVAGLAATILEGRLPTLKNKKGTKTNAKSRRAKSENGTITTTKDEQNTTDTTTPIPLQGLGRGRTSALTLGAPPFMSSNVQADFLLSLLHGDDFVSRATPASLDRLLQRARQKASKGGPGLFAPLNRMSDTLSLATSNLRTYAHGSEGEEARLALAGRAYLIRPRRLGGVCSIHEIGIKGGREAIRASVLWQLNDILLSKSLWKHHRLESYIQGLDRTHIRGIDNGGGGGGGGES